MWQILPPIIVVLVVVNLAVSCPRVTRVDDHGTIRLRGTASVRFLIADIESVDDIGRTARVAGWGMHGWRGHWTLNSRSSPGVRITFRSPATGRVLGFPVKVRVLDAAPLTAQEVNQRLGIPK
jgi:hypothetical protein